MEHHRSLLLKLSRRTQFAVIGQEPVLFSATVADNISYGRFDASRGEIVAAAAAAHAHEFILSLPRGYETKIGEGGSRSRADRGSGSQLLAPF